MEKAQARLGLKGPAWAGLGLEAQAFASLVLLPYMDESTNCLIRYLAISCLNVITFIMVITSGH
jgi:hypothetical protein